MGPCHQCSRGSIYHEDYEGHERAPPQWVFPSTALVITLRSVAELVMMSRL
jgi:hypothetical protein